ncbi:CDK5 regulatory subunit-associated protein 3-like [Lampetra planeri]
MEDQYKNIPIDIHTSKLLDWLVDRRHCGLRWQGAVGAIRERIAVAMRDMPEHPDIRSLLSGTHIQYFHCLRIVEILRSTEASSKNIFGRYSSQRMKDWQDIVSMYEKDNVYLAELANMLARSVLYEAPAVRRQMAKCAATQQEMSRREAECANAAAELREGFYVACRQHGISGDSVRDELLALLRELPGTLSEVASASALLAQHVALYQACVEFVCEGDRDKVLPLLRHVQHKGNTTVHEWRTGKPPSSLHPPTVPADKGDLSSPAKQEEAGGIDFGDFTAETPVDARNGGGEGDAQPGGEEAEGIDWEISLEGGGEDAGAGGDGGDGGGDAAWTIEVVDDGKECDPGSQGDGAGEAHGTDALTVLENLETRNQFIDELMELEAFLVQRAAELSEEADVLSINQFEAAPLVLQEQSRRGVEAALGETRALTQRLTSLKMRQLFMIHASPRYVDRLTTTLNQKLRQAEAALRKRDAAVQRQREALQEQVALQPSLDVLLARSRELQALIEGDISKRYHNRRVNLMGVAV